MIFVTINFNITINIRAIKIKKGIIKILKTIYNT